MVAGQGCVQTKSQTSLGLNATFIAVLLALAMADIQMDDAFNAFKKTSKTAKGPAEEDLLNDDLPWFVSHLSCSMSVSKSIHRVEKYRPVSLDDVVSHKDITSTSTFSL
jgi:hypothetical protein